MAEFRTNMLSRIDWITVGLYLFFVFFGWISIYSATYQEGLDWQLLDMETRASKQFVFILAALFLAVVVMLIDSKFWAFFAFPVYGISILLLIVVLFLGREINGAKSWFIIGPISFQPAEFAKIATVLAVSRFFSGFGFQFKGSKNILISFFLILFPALLIFLQNDTGSSLVYASFLLVFYRQGLNETFLVFGLLGLLLFIFTLLLPVPVLLCVVSGLILLIAGIRNGSTKIPVTGLLITALAGAVVYGLSTVTGLNGALENLMLATAGLTALIAFVLAYRKRIRNLYLILAVWIGALLLIASVDYVFQTVLEEHQRSRINQVLGVEHDPLGAGYNVNQSKIAIGSGGVLGKGFLQGTQTRFDFVPEQSTDFIFCTIGEEWGFTGSALVIILFSFFLIRLIILAERQRSVFSRVFGYGVVSVMFMHLLINIGMTIGLMPVIGIPLPFFSYGGSSLWSFTLMLFIFLHLDTDRYEVVV